VREVAAPDGLTREEALRIVARGVRPARTTTNATEVSSPELRAALTAATASPSAANLDQVAHAYLALGIRDQAFDHYAAALRLHADDAVAHDGIARIWRDWGWTAQALAAAHRAVFHAPTSSRAWNTLGTILERVHRPDDARRAYHRAAFLDARAWWAHVNLCGLELSKDDLHEAERQCEWARLLRPEQPLLDSLVREISRRRESPADPDGR
jgi:Flp pilus assembly protein TadD